jgi:hypothetical protein
VKTGESIIRTLVDSLKVGGFGAIHLTYREVDPSFASAVAKFTKNTPLVRNIANLLIGRSWDRPTMQMNNYSIPRVIDILTETGIPTFTAAVVDDWTHLGLFIFFRKAASGSVSPWSNPKQKK